MLLTLGSYMWLGVYTHGRHECGPAVPHRRTWQRNQHLQIETQTQVDKRMNVRVWVSNWMGSYSFVCRPPPNIVHSFLVVSWQNSNLKPTAGPYKGETHFTLNFSHLYEKYWQTNPTPTAWLEIGKDTRKQKFSFCAYMCVHIQTPCVQTENFCLQ